MRRFIAIHTEVPGFAVAAYEVSGLRSNYVGIRCEHPDVRGSAIAQIEIHESVLKPLGEELLRLADSAKRHEAQDIQSEERT